MMHTFVVALVFQASTGVLECVFFAQRGHLLAPFLSAIARVDVSCEC